MRLLFVRHGISEDKKPEDDDFDDFKRELTPEGIREIRKASRTYRHLLKKVDVVYSSPLIRALQTTQILFRKIKRKKYELMVTLDKLVDPSEFVDELQNLEWDHTYCFVGHEPQLSQIISTLLMSENSKVFMEFPMGGIVVLEGKGHESLKLICLMPPDI